MIHDDVGIAVIVRRRGHRDDESALSHSNRKRSLVSVAFKSLDSSPLLLCLITALSLEFPFHILAGWGLIGSAKRRRRGCSDRYPNPLPHVRRGRCCGGESDSRFFKATTLAAPHSLATQNCRIDGGTQPTCRRCRGDCEREPATQQGRRGIQICGGPGNVLISH